MDLNIVRISTEGAEDRTVAGVGGTDGVYTPQIIWPLPEYDAN